MVAIWLVPCVLLAFFVLCISMAFFSPGRGRGARLVLLNFPLHFG